MKEWSNVSAPVGEMSLDIHRCKPDELEPLIHLLDEEFIFSKGRTISLRLRFPTVYCKDNLTNIILCTDGAAIVSTLAIRYFDWHVGNEIFRGAMIGAVYTHPGRRGQGWASRLLEVAATQLREHNIDFGVLWTGQPSFYARFGWIAADCSVLGSITPDNSSAEFSDAITRMPISAGASLAEAIRQCTLNSMTVRDPEDYQQLPLPAEHVDFLWRENQGKAAYALLGSRGETGFLYELHGDSSCFPELWREICLNHRQIFVNDRTDSPSYRWLTDHANASWENKSLAMWLPLSKRVDIAHLEQWHIPYFDRI